MYDKARCDGCRGLLAAPHVQFGHKPCSCVPGGHRTLRCRDCGTVHYEPPHDPGAAEIRLTVGEAAELLGDDFAELVYEP